MHVEVICWRGVEMWYNSKHKSAASVLDAVEEALLLKKRGHYTRIELMDLVNDSGHHDVTTLMQARQLLAAFEGRPP